MTLDEVAREVEGVLSCTPRLTQLTHILGSDKVSRRIIVKDRDGERYAVTVSKEGVI